jgi:hypothetical protein
MDIMITWTYDIENSFPRVQEECGIEGTPIALIKEQKSPRMDE